MESASLLGQLARAACAVSDAVRVLARAADATSDTINDMSDDGSSDAINLMEVVSFVRGMLREAGRVQAEHATLLVGLAACVEFKVSHAVEAPSRTLPAVTSPGELPTVLLWEAVAAPRCWAGMLGREQAPSVNVKIWPEPISRRR